MEITLDRYFSLLGLKARESKRKLIYAWRAKRRDLEELCANPKTADLTYLSLFMATALANARQIHQYSFLFTCIQVRNTIHVQ
jgi:hypothetical protein